MVKPKKHLGQHFLKDENIAKAIADSLDSRHENVLEIGPGTGVLTKYLMQGISNFKVCEIDTESVEYLEIHYPQLRDKIIADDFLKTDIIPHMGNEFAIIGNFPYNISSQIFFRVLDYRNNIPEVVGMIQKEVAERIAAPPGNKTYGILSVLLQAWYDIEYLFTVSENVFNPPPKVKSAVIRLKRNQTQSLLCNEKLFFKIVKAGFNQRRKTLRNALKNGGYDISKIDPDYLSKRAEQLSVDDFIKIAQQIEKD